MKCGNNFFASEVMNMTEQKAVPLDVVVSDKGKKAKRIGKAFVNLDGKVPLSVTICMDALQSAIKDGTVSESIYEGNAQYPDTVLDGKKCVRMAGFKYQKKQ
jgi:hypothetical protein